MHEVFHGCRRKIGVVTLLLSCVILVAWIRSLGICDVISFRNSDHTTIHLASTQQLLVLVVERPVGHASTFSWFTFSDIGSPLVWQALPATAHPLNDPEILWSARSCGFGSAVQTRLPLQTTGPGTMTLNVNFKFVTIPYWSIILPLILITAYLLLGQSRTKTTDAPPAGSASASPSLH